jgi:hypothetical protein
LLRFCIGSWDAEQTILRACREREYVMCERIVSTNEKDTVVSKNQQILQILRVIILLLYQSDTMTVMPLLMLPAIFISLVGFVSVTQAWMITPTPLPNVLHPPQYPLLIMPYHRSILRVASSSDSSYSANTATATIQQSPIEFVQGLLQLLSSPDETMNKGQILLDASSEKWRQAIYQAIGVPTDRSTDTAIIAKSLQEKMSRPDNQFAILMGEDTPTTPFTIAFPSDIVDYRNDGTVWLECQLRHVDTNKLFVIMGINLIACVEDETTSSSSSWKILSLDWQDFRELFYPGLSGREWLRAF